jgi:hypothetical protein
VKRTIDAFVKVGRKLKVINWSDSRKKKFFLRKIIWGLTHSIIITVFWKFLLNIYNIFTEYSWIFSILIIILNPFLNFLKQKNSLFCWIS